MLRIWECDCAFCVIGNEFPCRQPHNPTPTLLRGLSTLPQGQKPLAVSRRKTPDDKMNSWKEVASNLPKTILHGRDAILRVRVKWLIFNIVSRLWADVKYHVPTGFGFSPKTSGFCPFVDATDLDRCEALASAKGCFLCFCFWFHPVIFYWTGKIGEKRWVSVQ